MHRAAERACAALTMQGNYTVRIRVYNEAGELVYSFPVTHYSEADPEREHEPQHPGIDQRPGSVTFHGVVLGTWNGTTNGGTEVTNGKYYIKVDNIDPTGVVNTQTQAVLVARHLATLTVNIYNEAGEIGAAPGPNGGGRGDDEHGLQPFGLDLLAGIQGRARYRC